MPFSTRTSAEAATAARRSRRSRPRGPEPASAGPGPGGGRPGAMARPRPGVAAGRGGSRRAGRWLQQGGPAPIPLQYGHLAAIPADPGRRSRPGATPSRHRRDERRRPKPSPVPGRAEPTPARSLPDPPTRTRTAVPASRVADRRGRSSRVAARVRVTLVAEVDTLRDGIAGKRSRRGVDVPERLSLLLPGVGSATDPSFLTAAFRSTVIDQTRPPDQVVIVRDGPVAADARRPHRGAGRDEPGPGGRRGARAQRRPRPRARRRAGGLPPRRRRPHGRRRHQPAAPLRRADADHRGGGGHRRVRPARVRRGRRRRRRPPDPADRSRRHPRPARVSPTPSTTPRWSTGGRACRPSAATPTSR